MRIWLAIATLASALTFGAFAQANAQEVMWDKWRGPRTSVCTEFVRTKPPICNFNRMLPMTDRSECRLYYDNGGTVSILCAEDNPRYAWMQRLVAVARSCGENSYQCVGAYFEREGSQCVYRVVPDTWPTSQFEVRLSDLPNEWRILLVKDGDGFQHGRYERRFAAQTRDQLRKRGYGYADPCTH